VQEVRPQQIKQEEFFEVNQNDVSMMPTNKAAPPKAVTEQPKSAEPASVTPISQPTKVLNMPDDGASAGKSQKSGVAKKKGKKKKKAAAKAEDDFFGGGDE
jgi:hypothetical protein